MIFQNSIDKLSRGCGNEYVLESDDGSEIRLVCGHQHQGLCPSCQAQLTLLQNLSKQVEHTLGLCKICDGTHGKWIKKEEIKQNLEKL